MRAGPARSRSGVGTSGRDPTFWRFHETHPLGAAGGRPAARRRPPRRAEVEGREGDPGLPARAAERSRQEHQGVLVEYGPGGYSPGHTHAKSAFIYATV